jgi:hypothetical protein
MPMSLHAKAQRFSSPPMTAVTRALRIDLSPADRTFLLTVGSFSIRLGQMDAEGLTATLGYAVSLARGVAGVRGVAGRVPILLRADDLAVRSFGERELLPWLLTRLPVLEGAVLPGPANAPAGRRRFLIGPLMIDGDTHTVRVAGSEVPVTSLEMRLLLYLAAAEGAVCGRQDILVDVWHYTPGVRSRTVDIHIKRLRDKLGPAAALLRTVRGVGYSLAQP